MSTEGRDGTHFCECYSPMKRLRTTSLSPLMDAIAQDGAVIVAGPMLTTKAVLGMAQDLGRIIAPGVAMDARMHRGGVYSVRVRNGGKGVEDKYGNTIYSTTDLPFELHTDAYNSTMPPRYVFLFRVDSSREIPDSFLAEGNAAVDLLEQEVVATLSKAAFPSAQGLVPVLTADWIRFNRLEIKRWNLSRSPAMSSMEAAAIDALGDALWAVRETIQLRNGELLLLDNWRVCHGRSGLDSGSARIVQRVWVAGQ